jgi:hypothetical protein
MGDARTNSQLRFVAARSVFELVCNAPQEPRYGCLLVVDNLRADAAILRKLA